MSIMSTISKPEDRPYIMTICGDAGTGKTSLACSFTSPTIVIRSEDGLSAIPKDKRPDAFPVVTTTEMLVEQLKALVLEEHKYKTLVIDSVTSLERMFIQDIIDNDPKAPRGIQQALGGYGNGRDAVAVMHARVRKAAGILAEKRGMNTVFVAHADINRIDPPDDDSYSRYVLRLHEKSTPHYIDDVDLVGFLKLETFVRGEGERKKAISDGSRVLIAYATAANVSKNRLGITEPIKIPFGENPLLKLMGEQNQ